MKIGQKVKLKAPLIIKLKHTWEEKTTAGMVETVAAEIPANAIGKITSLDPLEVFFTNWDMTAEISDPDKLYYGQEP